jgi:hypothetical protein
MEFRSLCRNAPAMKVEALPEPKADPERVKAELAKLGQVRQAQVATPRGMKDWAYRLKARHESGIKLNAYQIACYRAALKA